MTNNGHQFNFKLANQSLKRVNTDCAQTVVSEKKQCGSLALTGIPDFGLGFVLTLPDGGESG